MNINFTTLELYFQLAALFPSGRGLYFVAGLTSQVLSGFYVDTLQSLSLAFESGYV